MLLQYAACRHSHVLLFSKEPPERSSLIIQLLYLALHRPLIKYKHPKQCSNLLSLPKKGIEKDSAGFVYGIHASQGVLCLLLLSAFSSTCLLHPQAVTS